jgi:hypothetical protein
MMARLYLPRSGLLEQNAGEGPGLLLGLLEVPDSGKFIFLLELFGFKKPGPSTPRYAFEYKGEHL